ncbi:permease prefix domain 1-containing protein [Desulfosporosinus sp. SB140]|uniref:permease prefix domain 1-containing protein n=1 Tax=Desulfosporosinus paludis TaxID=3115649 RepID=UPI003890DDAC
MLSPKSEEFLQKVLSYVKFSFDHRAIKDELENHLIDRMQDYREQGYAEEEAEQMAVSAMGDAQEIGRELNREHNPIIGWLWRTSHFLVVLLVITNLYFVGLPIAISVGDTLMKINPAAGIPKSDIVYNLPVHQKVKLDDTVINFTNLVLEKNGDLNIFYRYYDTSLWGGGWNLGDIGVITDNLGNRYYNGSGSGDGGIVSTCRRTINHFAENADTLIISYDYFNRQYRVEIPLKKVKENEY